MKAWKRKPAASGLVSWQRYGWNRFICFPRRLWKLLDLWRAPAVKVPVRDPTAMLVSTSPEKTVPTDGNAKPLRPLSVRKSVLSFKIGIGWNS